MKKFIIAGGRDFNDKAYLVEKVLDLIFLEKDAKAEIVSGGASGADKLGEEFALRMGCRLTSFPADWDTHGKAAGPIRNEKMAEYADACIVFWDGKSRGTKNMIDMALKHKLELHVFFY